MIDIATETIITLEDAAKRLLVNPSTVLRWVTQGAKGLKLEAMRVGGRWRTSVEALQRFADAQTPRQEPYQTMQSPVRTPAERQRRAEEAGRRLDEMLGVRWCAKCDVKIEALRGSIPKQGPVWCPNCLVTRKSATLGHRIRTFRCAAFLSQQALSSRTGILIEHIRAYEYDERQPSEMHLTKLREVLGAKLVSVLDGHQEVRSDTSAS
jgi:excisionase family DNA binding protein